MDRAAFPFGGRTHGDKRELEGACEPCTGTGVRPFADEELVAEVTARPGKRRRAKPNRAS